MADFTKQNYLTFIYTIILLKSVCLSVRRRSQTAGHNSCSIVSGDVSNCSYRLTVHPVTSSRLSSVQQFFYMRKPSINYHESRPSRIWLLNGPAAPVTMRSATVTVEWPVTRRCIDTTAVILRRTDLPKTAKINKSKLRQ